MTLEISFSNSMVIKGVCAESACIEDISAYTENACTKSTCARGKYDKGVCTRGACIKASYGKITCIGDASIGNTCGRVACIGNTSARGACARSAYVKGVFVGGDCVGSTCARSVGAVEHLGIHLQFFWISEVKLFGTGLETEAEVGW